MEFAGTPLYMAPELFDGHPSGIKTELYALGLVLYEIFTGVHPFGKQYTKRYPLAGDPNHPDNLPSPSSLAADLDPSLDRVITRCLENDPALRPSSIQEIAIRLPGGDPLSAAVAAGETPSPEVVAAAGGEGTLEPWVALALLASVVACLIALTLLPAGGNIQRLARLEMSPEELAGRARHISQMLGYARPADHEYWLNQEQGFVSYFLKSGPAPGQRRALLDAGPGVLTLGYSESPRPFSFEEDGQDLRGLGKRAAYQWSPGTVRIKVDGKGRLLSFSAVPPKHTAPEARPIVQWTPLFKEAGLEPELFREVTPSLAPPVAYEERKEWVQERVDGPVTPARIGAAELAGQVVWFEVIWPWEKVGPEPAVRVGSADLAYVLICSLVTLLGFLLVRRNLKSGRGDRRGALRVGLVVALARLLFSVLTSRPPTTPFGYWELSMSVIGAAVSEGLLVWAIYLGLEPYVRRLWPRVLIGSSRLLAGRWRDPLVGRHVLLGICCGLVAWLSLQLILSLPSVAQVEIAPQSWIPVSTSQGLAWLLFEALRLVYEPLILLGLVFVLRLILRRDWLAVSAFALVMTGLLALPLDIPLLGVVVWLSIFGAAAVALTRWGLLTVAAAHVPFLLSLTFSFNTPSGYWTPWNGWLGASVVLALAIYGFWTALGKRRLFLFLDSLGSCGGREDLDVR